MDPTIGGLPNQVAGAASNGERRRWVRQKLHTPVYASFNGPQTAMVLDLSELLDLHEDGFAVRTSEPLETNRAVTLCLELPETKSYIHGSGKVIWSDETGRGGIRFSPLPDSARHKLKEWLFANLLIACSNHVARTEQLARHAGEELPEPLPVNTSSPIVEISSVETGLAPSQARQPASLQLEAVRRQVLEIGDDFDVVFQIITEHALVLTGADGAALAFLTDDKMVCRARSGEPAPPLGTPVDVKQGLSGECVRSALLVSCEDTDNDPRIDPGVGRALGIGSLMAVPIVSDFRVVGLLEVLAPHPRAFSESHGMVLKQLVEMIPRIRGDHAQLENADLENAQLENAQPANAKATTPTQSDDGSQPPASESSSTESVSTEPSPKEFDSIPALREALKERELESVGQLSQPLPGEGVSETVPEPLPEPDAETPPAAPARLLYRALLGLTIAAVAMAAGYLLGPAIERRWADSPQVSHRSAAQEVERAEAASIGSAPRPADQGSNDQRTQTMSLPALRKLADQGDAEAQWQMAVRYHNGEDVPRDDAQAMQWYLRAAQQGNVAAQSALGAYYWAGRGVPEDLSKAYMWSEIALAGGDENSKSRLEGLASLMTKEQVYAARQQADEWVHTHTQRAKSEVN